ncbi:MAG TPA: DUF1398 family protein [Rhizomicrobium sp.]|jgi:uncharacterized protein YbcV (DUF1398 family)
MNVHLKSVAEACTKGSEDGSLTFPGVLGKLIEAGMEGYYADLRRATRVYYLPSGESIETGCESVDVPVAEIFEPAAVEAAVRQSQANAHTYKDFCKKVMAAGCAGYLVSLPGRRVVYFGRTAETHVEHFPA